MEGDLLANEPPLSPDRFARAMAKVDWQSVHAEMRAKTGLDGDHSPRKPACDEATDPPASRKPTRDELERLVAVYDAALEESNQIRIALAERVEALEAEAATRIRAEKDERIALDERIGALQAEIDAMTAAWGDAQRYARRMRREEAAKEKEKEEEPRPPSPFVYVDPDANAPVEADARPGISRPNGDGCGAAMRAALPPAELVEPEVIVLDESDDNEDEERKRRRRRGRGRGRPKKRAISPYMVFCKKTRPKVVAENPELDFGDVGRRLGEMWRRLGDEEKKKYRESGSGSGTEEEDTRETRTNTRGREEEEEKEEKEKEEDGDERVDGNAGEGETDGVATETTNQNQNQSEETTKKRPAPDAFAVMMGAAKSAASPAKSVVAKSSAAKPSEGGGPVPAPAPAPFEVPVEFEVPEVPTASPGSRKRMRVSMSDSPGTPPGIMSADSPEAETSDVGDVLIRRKKAAEAEATEAAELLLDRLKKASEAAELILLSDEMTCEPLIKYNLAAAICGLNGDNRADVNMVRQRVREMRIQNVENNQTDATERRVMQQKLLKAAQLYVVYKSLKQTVTHVSAAQEVGLDETSEDSVRKYAQLYQNADVNKLRWTLSWLPWEGPMEPWRKEEAAWMKAQEEWFKAKAEESRWKKPAGGEKEEMSPEPDEEVDVEAIQKQQEEEEEEEEDDDDEEEEEEEEEGRETGPDEGPAAERAGVAVKLEPDFDNARRTAPSARMDDERCVVS